MSLLIETIKGRYDRFLVVGRRISQLMKRRHDQLICRIFELFPLKRISNIILGGGEQGERREL